MKIHITECLGSKGTLLELLANYSRIDKLIDDILKQDVYCPFHDIAICFNGCWYWVRHCGENEKEFPIKELKKVKSYLRCIPNDTMIIECDVFESELYINLDGDDDDD